MRPLAVACVLLGSASTLFGSLLACCVGSSFEDQVSRAKLIFVGTLTSAEPVRLSNTIVTRYRFDDVQYLKGHGPANGLILVQDGGCYGGECIVTSVQVSFTVGTRYVEFADSGYWSLPREYSPMVCGNGHPFAIRADSGSAMPVVHAGDGTRVTEDEFVRALRHIIDRVSGDPPD